MPRRHANPNQLSLFALSPAVAPAVQPRIIPPPLIDRPATSHQPPANSSSLLAPRSEPLRDYQIEAIAFAKQHGSAIIVLPTNTGKTEVEFHLAADVLEQGKVICVADKTLLCEQHFREAKERIRLKEDEVVLAIGNSRERAADKKSFYANARLIIGTPETLVNDIASGALDLKDVKLGLLDEVHHTQGNDAYAKLGAMLASVNINRVGLSASPAESGDRLQALLEMLQISIGADAVFIRTDKDTEKYVRKPAEIKVFVTLEDERKRALTLLFRIAGDIFGNMLASARTARLGSLTANYSFSKFRLPLHEELENGHSIVDDACKRLRGKKPWDLSESERAIFDAMKYHAALWKITKCYDYLARIGSEEFNEFAGKILEDRKTKAAELIRDDGRFRECVRVAATLSDHPKTDAILRLLASNDRQGIIFVETHAHARRLANFLNEHGISAHELLGSSGMTKKRQSGVRADFEAGKYRILVATSVAEEGLHLPVLHTGIFYSPAHTSISYQQRRGRVRDAEGRVFILIADETSDVSLYYATRGRDRSVAKALEGLRA